MAEVVVIRFQDLLDTRIDVTEQIEQAFGPCGLGILTVSGVPSFVSARSKLLQLGARFANLPNDVKQRYEDAASRYSVGWSHGKEFLKPGKPDIYKGSYYANPLFDEAPACGDSSNSTQPPPFPANLWPTQDLPELEAAFKQLGRLIIDVGLLLAQRCDRYVSERNPSIKPGSIYRMLKRSRTPVARLLHYFPPNAHSAPNGEDASSWCGWHTDHGSLTGLCSAMYVKDGCPVPCPDPQSGLYICDRHGDVVKAAIPADHVAFQLGEALQVACGGLLRATPHYVRAAYGPAATDVSRNTFAVFMQPDADEVVEPPPNCADSMAAGGVAHWRQGLTFGQFHRETIGRYYSANLRPQGGADKGGLAEQAVLQAVN